MSLLSKFLFITTLTTISFSAQAGQWGGYLGINTTEYSGDGNWDRDFGAEIGSTYLMPLYGSLVFRTGAGFTQKNSELGDISVKFTYIEIPITLLIPATAQLSFFGGLNFDLLIGDSPGDISGEKSFIFNVPLGVHYNLSGPHSIEGILEFGMTDMASSASGGTYQIGNSLVGRYHYSF